MIVIAIVGVLSGVALPNLLSNRDRAQAQAEIGSLMSFAKQCSGNMLSENPIQISNLTSNITPLPAPPGACFTIAAGAIGTTFRNTDPYTNAANLEGIMCGQDAAGVEQLNTGAQTICTITVHDGTGAEDMGLVTGAWS